MSLFFSISYLLSFPSNAINEEPFSKSDLFYVTGTIAIFHLLFLNYFPITYLIHINS